MYSHQHHEKSQDLETNEKYGNYINDAIILKKETNGIINLFETKTNGNTVYNLFNHFSKLIVTEQIRFEEAIWLENTKSGAIIWGDQYKGSGYKYDYCSMYPYIMQLEKNIYPIKKGQFIKLTQESFENCINNNKLEFGIYRCMIKKSDNPISKKLFRWNPKNFYTHIDIIQAHKLNLNIKLLKDRQPNFLYYSDVCCLPGCHIFRAYVDFVFPLKKKKLPRAKAFLTMLWGVLGQRSDLGYKILRNDPSSIELDSIKYRKLNGTLYRTNYARTVPFVLAYGRELICATMLPFIDNIMRCHTDGFISKIPINFPTGQNLGELKYEGYAKCVIIHNSNDIEGEFTLD